MNEHLEDMSPQSQALLVGLFEQRELIDLQLKETPLTPENRIKIFSLQNSRNKVVNKINSIIFSSDKEYADEEFGYQVFKYIADNPQMDNGKRENIKQALESARLACKKEEEWVEEVKGNSYLFTSNNLKQLASNGDLALLMKFNTLKKRNIMGRSTLNSAVGEFSDQKSLAERLHDHQSRIKSLEKTTRKMSQKQDAQQAHLRMIDKMMGEEKPDWKVTAAMLKGEGFTQEAIAGALNLNISTIKRHWDKLE